MITRLGPKKLQECNDKMVQYNPYHRNADNILQEFYARNHINKFCTISKFIEVDEKFCISDKRSLLNTIKFQGISQARIEKHLLIRVLSCETKIC